MRNSLVAILFVLLIAIPAVAQDAEDQKPVVVSDAIMEQVVRRVLTWYFRPRSKPTTIKLDSELIREEWLPKIRNVDFVILQSSSESDWEHAPRVFFFRNVEKDGRWYTVDFGYGEPHCNNAGDTWRFRVVGPRVRLYKWTDVGWGGGCASSSGDR